MRIAFEASEAGFEADEFALICGVSNDSQYLTFQRDPEDSDTDWGVHLEYGGQADGGYACIRECRVSRNELAVDLSSVLGGVAVVEGFDVTLRIDDESFGALSAGLRACSEAVQRRSSFPRVTLEARKAIGPHSGPYKGTRHVVDNPLYTRRVLCRAEPGIACRSPR
jgi:hypothetical protein